MNVRRPQELPEKRIRRLVRVYHSAGDASRATGVKPESLKRAARNYGLKFRSQEQAERRAAQKRIPKKDHPWRRYDPEVYTPPDDDESIILD